MWAHTHNAHTIFVCYYLFFFGYFSKNQSLLSVYKQMTNQRRKKDSQVKNRGRFNNIWPKLIGVRGEKACSVLTNHQHKLKMKRRHHRVCVHTHMYLMRAFNDINGNMCRQYFSGLFYNTIIIILMLSSRLKCFERTDKSSKWRNEENAVQSRTFLSTQSHRRQWCARCLCCNRLE